MQRRTVFALSVLVVAAATSCFAAAQDFKPDAILALERGALDRWIKGDPQGYLEIYADNVTYFDPATARRIDGIEAMRALLTPLTGRFKLARYEILAPDVYRRGDLAVLSYNLVTYAEGPDGELTARRWNTTSAYALIGGRWKIVHNHFSLTQPQAASAPAK
jgi:ketosteroid isomerase-like protein